MERWPPPPKVRLNIQSIDRIPAGRRGLQRGRQNQSNRFAREKRIIPLKPSKKAARPYGRVGRLSFN
jgi:hypothetical protein